jgi:hypothetical protein
LEVKEATNPESYNWENFGYTRKQRFFRRIISAIGLIVIFFIVTFIQSFFEIVSNDIGDVVPSADCPANVQYNDALDDYDLPDNERNGDYICFCD